MYHADLKKFLSVLRRIFDERLKKVIEQGAHDKN